MQLRKVQLLKYVNIWINKLKQRICLRKLIFTSTEYGSLYFLPRLLVTVIHRSKETARLKSHPIYRLVEIDSGLKSTRVNY